MTATEALPTAVLAAPPRPALRTLPAAAAPKVAGWTVAVPWLALSLALHTGAMLGAIGLLHAPTGPQTSRAIHLRFEESDASTAAVAAPTPPPPAAFAAEVNEPPVPTREVQETPERFESVLARMNPPAPQTPLADAVVQPPKAGGWRQVDLLQKVRVEPTPNPALPATEAEPPTESAAVAAPDSALVLAPLAGLNPQPEYPAAARRNGIEGTTLLALQVDVDGTVTGVRVVTSSGNGLLDAAALRAARKWRFENGPGSIEVPFVFRLRPPQPD
ncbi:MAG: TonB protein [Planctomycetota bacterium]